MFTTIRARIVALCVAIVVAALAINTVLNQLVANRYNEDAIDSSLAAVQSGHTSAIVEWVASHSQMIQSLQESVLQPEPDAALRQVADAGRFTNIHVGYADKTAKFSKPEGISAPL